MEHHNDLPDADFFAVESQLSGRERLKLAQVRELLDAEVRPHAATWWRDEHFPLHLLPAFARLGLSAPARHGYSHLFEGLFIAELCRADASLATFFMIHHGLFVEALHAYGTDGQRERYLADAAALRATGAFGLTEPDHGSDVARGMETTARREGGHWVLNGRKRWIGNGTFCHHMLVWAADAEGGQTRGFIVDTSLPGFTAVRIEHKTALRTVQNADVALDGVRVQEEDRLQGVDSFADINALLLASRIAVAWEAVGLQLAAYDAARRHVLERQQFGRPLAAFQLVQQQLVKMLGNATASLAMMAQVAALQDQGAADMGQAALAKAFTTERMRETVALGRSLFGGNGILSDHPMAKLFADAEAIYTYEGTYEINSLIAGRAATGISAFT